MFKFANCQLTRGHCLFLVELQRSQTFKWNGAFDRNVSNRSHDWFYLSVDVFLNEAFQSFVDLTTWMFFVNCQAYVVSFYFGVELHWTQAGFFHFWAWKVRRHYDQGHAFISHDKRRRLFRPNDGRAATRIHVCNILQLCRATMKQERSKTRGNMRKQCLKATSDGSRNQTSISAVASSYAWDTLEIPLGSKNTWPKSPSRTCRQHFGTFPAQSATLFYSAWSWLMSTLCWLHSCKLRLVNSCMDVGQKCVPYWTLLGKIYVIYVFNSIIIYKCVMFHCHEYQYRIYPDKNQWFIHPYLTCCCLFVVSCFQCSTIVGSWSRHSPGKASPSVHLAMVHDSLPVCCWS